MENKDYTLIQKISSSEYRIMFLYPNEDYDAIRRGEEKEVVLWSTNSYYDPSIDKSIQDFVDYIEKAYLDFFDTPEECLQDLQESFSLVYFNSEKQLEANLGLLKEGEIGFAPYN